MIQLCHMPFYRPQECIREYREMNVIHYYVNQDQTSYGQPNIIGKRIVPNETIAFLY